MRNQKSLAGLVYLYFLLALWNYSYLYAYPFKQGISDAPIIFYLPKYIFWLILSFFLILFRGFVGLRQYSTSPLFFFFSWIFFVHLLHFSQYESVSHANNLLNLLFFVPSLILITNQEARLFFEILPLHLVVQVAISLIMLYFGIHLWDEKSIVGAFGNANSFGLILNIAMLWLLTNGKKITFKQIGYVLIFVLGVFFTKSGSQLGVMIVIFVLIAVAQVSRHLFKVIVLSVLCFIGVIVAWNLNWLDKNLLLAAGGALQNALSLFGIDVNIVGETSIVSRSVELREEIHLFTWNYLMEATALEILFGNFSNAEYLKFDSQFLMFLVNYGLISFLGFLAVLWWLFLVAIQIYVVKRDFFPLGALIAFVLTFLFSRVLYYFPINFVFFLTLVCATENHGIRKNINGVSCV